MKVLAICILAVIMISCKGETGPTGPQGNANVKTQTITVYASDYSLSSGNYSCQKSCGIVTQDIINSGAVLVYHRSVDTWVQYPLTITYDYTRGYTYTFFVGYFLNYIGFAVEDSNPNTSTLPNGAIGTFKVVTIAGNIGILNYIDKSDYGAVKTALNITD